MYKIVTDSAADIFGLETIPFAVVPLTISTDERTFVDGGIEADEMVDYLASYKGRSYSACPSSDTWREAFGDAKYVFCVAITSKLSGSYNAARIAAEDYMEEYPDRRVYVVDTLSAGPGMRILVNRLEELILESCSFDEIVDKIEKYKAETELLFMLSSVKNFANNGRISPAIAKIVMAMKLRIVGKATEGELDICDKSRGEKRGIAAMIAKMEELGYSGGKVLIDHCRNAEGAETLATLIKEKYPSAEIEIKRTGHLCSFYAEEGGMLMGYEIKK